MGGKKERNGGMADFDSLMLTSTGIIFLMERAAAGRMKETERDRRFLCVQEGEREMRKGETSKSGKQKVQIH